MTSLPQTYRFKWGKLDGHTHSTLPCINNNRKTRAATVSHVSYTMYGIVNNLFDLLFRLADGVEVAVHFLTSIAESVSLDDDFFLLGAALVPKIGNGITRN